VLGLPELGFAGLRTQGVPPVVMYRSHIIPDAICRLSWRGRRGIRAVSDRILVASARGPGLGQLTVTAARD